MLGLRRQPIQGLVESSCAICFSFLVSFPEVVQKTSQNLPKLKTSQNLWQNPSFCGTMVWFKRCSHTTIPFFNITLCPTVPLAAEAFIISSLQYITLCYVLLHQLWNLFQSVHFKWQNDKTHLLVVLHLSLALRLPHHFLHSINHNGHTWRPLVLCSIPVLNLSEARFVLTVSEVRKSKWQNAWNQRIDLQKHWLILFMDHGTYEDDCTNLQSSTLAISSKKPKHNSVPFYWNFRPAWL